MGAAAGAIGVEVAATAALPRTHGFRDPLWTALVLGGYAALDLAAGRGDPAHPGVGRPTPSGPASAPPASPWSACCCLGERLDLVKAAALLMIIGGVVVLNLHGAH